MSEEPTKKFKFDTQHEKLDLYIQEKICEQAALLNSKILDQPSFQLCIEKPSWIMEHDFLHSMVDLFISVRQRVKANLLDGIKADISYDLISVEQSKYTFQINWQVELV